jgi:hypothetical protein
VAINAVSYSVPDFRGLFLRGTDPTLTIDPFDNLFRASLVDYASSNTGRLGTIQFDVNQYHQHTASLTSSVNITGADKLMDDTVGGPGSDLQGYSTSDGFSFSSTTTLSGTASGNTGFEGNQQTVTINANIMYVVKY